ncbi:cytosolic sulfotransferase 5-like [Panicum miliaceum]|uniref:Sulfotransferase n=1 Tax=Panicum miliaceum TaxID=4540 RepID=A0A3L6Q9T7_PANMI|nr:cytosolic sulfotransferase 5-like [Panicum miliaceum]
MAEAQIQIEHGGQEEGEEGLATSRLPTREGWWKPFFLFQGCWLTPQVVKSVALVQAQFRPRAGDVVLATHPKGGTTWLKALAFTVANRSRHAVAGEGHPVLTSHPQDLVPFLELPFRVLRPVAELEALHGSVRSDWLAADGELFVLQVCQGWRLAELLDGRDGKEAGLHH